MRILGTRRQLQEVANKMARVTGKKGTLNEGVVGDVAVIENLTDGADHDEEWKPADEPSADVERLAQAVVRGEVADYSANPVDLLTIEQNDLNDRAHDVVLLADAGAAKGAHLGAQVDYEEPEAEALPPVGEPAEEAASEKKASKKGS